jgi:hypothetical protein
MVIRYVSIKNFRGIRELKWCVESKIACLIGPGDSTKTTILDAIECALSSRWNLTFYDSDFFECKPENDIEIVVIVGELSNALVADNRFGMYINGWTTTGELTDDPGDGSEPVVAVRLKVDRTLEPEWFLQKTAVDTKRLSARDRESIGLFRCIPTNLRDFSWVRGSAFSKMIEDAESVTSELAEATRHINRGIESESLRNATTEVTRAGAEVGARSKQQLAPLLDHLAISLSKGSIALHDGDVPLAASGTGTKRLFALGMALKQVSKGGIILIDEIETGLEPYRILHVLRKFKALVNAADAEIGQVIMTSIHQRVLTGLDANDLYRTTSSDGKTSVKRVPSSLQALVRGLPDSLLSPSVIICEGKTEFGILLALDSWIQEHSNVSLSYFGVGYVEGSSSESGGTNAVATRAKQLASLGYRVAIFVDSDQPLSNPSENELETLGVAVIKWEGNCNTEKRVITDVSVQLLQEIVDLLVEFGESENNIFRTLTTKLQLNYDPNMNHREFLVQNHTQLRPALLDFVLEKESFKRVDKGERLGTVIMKSVDTDTETALARTLQNLKRWADIPLEQQPAAERPNT